MKKLILSAVVLLGTMSIHANVLPVSIDNKATVIIQSEYTEVTADAVPAAVKTALQTAYPGAKLEKAFVNEKKEYKLEISVGDQKATVYSDVNGNWLKI
ncbi:PepSY-like domain-containing protein [Flavobacterium chungbukense]|uniref:Beta-lactamase-inhibitor-like PepSY-like domain-containing protein n=1 Tax=Flavobacterium chungbukense TaxID=877464 RepID=A0ABP7YCC7_9FLAO|nr:PepSY-like domain-containing protein [Flavobacterium chungbukense]MCC4923486.1 PepSY-like domain-containing protein [Flavobacterium chungbukense]